MNAVKLTCMKVGIIGAGFTGLAAAYRLCQNDHNVTLFEKQKLPGGLAIGFRDKNWQWSLEEHYHHLFPSDWAIRNLAKEINHKIIFKRLITSSFIDGKVYQLDSVKSLLSFGKLSLLDRLRTGVALAYFKFSPSWNDLEKVTASKLLKKTMGKKSWEVLWEPLLSAKFGKHKDKISAAWFWARIKKRSPKLGYPEGGFRELVKNISQNIERKGGKIFYNTTVLTIYSKQNNIYIKTGNNKIFKFDRVICTLPTPFFLKITKGLSKDYIKKLSPLRGLGATNLILVLKDKLLEDNTYWLNIHNPKYPFLAVVEHTNFMEPKHYQNERLVYIGNYLEPSHEYFQKSEKELIDEYFPYLKKINPKFKKSSIKKAWFFKATFAQPIVPLNYSKIMPKFSTSIPRLFLVNIQQVYPWDRGTNYAVELGEKIAKKINEK